MMAQSRLETVEKLKASLTAQIDAVLGDLKSEMGAAETHATRKASQDITKTALENQAAPVREEGGGRSLPPQSPRLLPRPWPQKRLLLRPRRSWQ